jgi:hypothetical protein
MALSRASCAFTLRAPLSSWTNTVRWATGPASTAAIEQPGPASGNGLLDARRFMGSQIVHHDDISRYQCWPRHVLAIGAKYICISCISGAVDGNHRLKALAPEGAHHGDIRPVVLGHAAHDPLLLGGRGHTAGSAPDGRPIRPRTSGTGDRAPRCAGGRPHVPPGRVPCRAPTRGATFFTRQAQAMQHAAHRGHADPHARLGSDTYSQLLPT